jgi:hypothetical protein
VRLLPVLRDLPMTGQTSPARLLRLGALLVAACLLTALVCLVSGLGRQGAMADATGRVDALRVASAQLYGALSDADASAAAGYVAGGVEPAEVRARYDRDIQQAGAALVTAASGTEDGDPARPLIGTVVDQLPVYTGLVETARTYNRQGLPLGQSYLGSASQLMRETILPSVARLRGLETGRMAHDFGAGAAFPFALLLVGLGALACTVDASVREYRRTNRVLSAGLATAAGLLAVLLLWWVLALALAQFRVAAADRHGTAVVTLEDARADLLAARSNESLVLVARSGAGASDSGFTDLLARVLGPGGSLDTARRSVGDDPDTAAGLDRAQQAVRAWQAAHQQLRALDDGGQYPSAVASATGDAPDSSNVRFAQADQAVLGVLDDQRRLLDGRSAAAGGSLDGLAVGGTLLAVLAGVAAAVGIAARVREYR